MRCQVTLVSEEQADRLSDALVCCAFCGEPFKECDTVIPGVGVIVGETDVVKWRTRYWHLGCVRGFEKPENSGNGACAKTRLHLGSRMMV
jgi:hypothetical protein